MHQVRVLTPARAAEVLPIDTCWALWREGVPCPNKADWRVQNTTDEGHSLMCTLHKEAFAVAEPFAAVHYIAMQQQPPPVA